MAIKMIPGFSRITASTRSSNDRSSACAVVATTKKTSHKRRISAPINCHLYLLAHIDSIRKTHISERFRGAKMSRSINSASTLIRGGQTTHHWWRMGAQVVKFSLVVAAVLYIATFLYLVLSSYNAAEMRIAIYYEMAERGVLDNNGFNRPYTFQDLNGQLVTVDAVDLYRNTTYRSVRDGFFERIFSASRLSVIPAIIGGIVSLFVFFRAGSRIKENEFVRGARLVTARQLKQWSELRWRTYHKTHKGRKKAKPLTIGGIPFPPNAVEAQTCLYGTVGVGKTNAMAEMLETIRENGGRAIIYDRTGSFVSRFYDETRDHIFNPFDNRSRSWNLFDDVLDEASFTQMAEVMIPEHRGAASDPFWSQSARIVFDYAASELYKKGPRTTKALIDYVMRMDASELSKLIGATPGKHFFNEEIEKTAQSIRANLISDLRFLEFLRDDGERISIREWVADDKPSFLFLTADAEHAAATRNLISAILEIAANALMSLGRAPEPRCYFFMDEVPSLNRLPCLVSSLAEIRQYGGAFVLGYQVYSQLEDIYGREAAQSIAGTTNNRIVFNTPDFRTAKLCSETLGNMDQWEANSNISVGAHAARDGVGFTSQRVERSVVSPAEIQNLPQFQAYLKFAYDSPTAPITMKLVDIEETQPSFLPYMGTAFGQQDFPIQDRVREARAQENGDIVTRFHEWCRVHFDCTDIDFEDTAGPHPRFAVYFAHFEEATDAGVPPSHIKPLVLGTEGLMRNTGQPPKPKAKPDTTKAKSVEPEQHDIPTPGPMRGISPHDDGLPDPDPRDLSPPPPNDQEEPLPAQAQLPFPDSWVPSCHWRP
ncbi:type IV secretion system DNA-binding domain-containing protein [Yoonia sp. SS1-5]|uniref:Type IV secretion system DNA-binding domain-containing protein n=1 Tax=Yoonia rhodophyticola TaxID=3137370 RepID=A0AAN0M6Y4_9RHOB